MEMEQETYLDEELEPEIPIQGIDIFFSLLSVGLAYFLIQVFTVTNGGLWLTVLAVVASSCVLFYFKNKRVPLKRSQLGYLLYFLLLATSFSLVENSGWLLPNFLFLILSFMYWILVLSGARRENQLTGSVFFELVQGLFVRPFSDFWDTMASYKPFGKGKKRLNDVTLGLVISLPILVIVLSLLSGADSLFGELLQTIFHVLSTNVWQYFIQLLVAIPLGFYFFLYVFQNQRKGRMKPKTTSRVNGSTVLFLTILSVFIIVYCLFFTTAVVGYFRVRSSAPTGSVLSDYARTGFFQLLVVALINVSIFLIIKAFSQEKTIIKSALTLIGIETMGLILLALAKMYLYITAFGLTNLRYNTTWFMWVLLVCVVLFIASLWKSFNYLRLTIIFVACCILGISYRNTGNDITSYNYEKYRVGELKELDLSVFESVGIGGVPTAIKIYQETANPELKTTIKAYLLEQKSMVKTAPTSMITWQRAKVKALLENIE